MSDLQKAVGINCFIAALTGKFIASKEIVLSEALIYISLAFVIVMYWGFSAWLTHQKNAVQLSHASDTDLASKVEELGEEQAAMKTKVNALILSAGLR